MNPDKFNLFCNAIADFHVDHVIILKNGAEIARRDWVPEERQNQYSLSKSFTGTAVAFALDEGVVHMEDKITDLLPDKQPDTVSPELAALRFKHLITMTVGQQKPQLMGDARRALTEKDWVKYVLAQPFDREPGTTFQYSNTGPYLAGIILEKLTGMSLVDYLMPRLFDPLEIPRPEWEVDPDGHIFGAGGMWLSSTEVSRFGQLYLQNGIWEGKQVLPKGWVQKVEQTVIPVGKGKRDYSLLFWRSRHDSYSAVGKFGQYCTILKEKNAVIVINSDDRDDNNFLEYVWTYLYPTL